MGLLDLFKKKKFDETDLKSITYKRYWLDPISTILIPTDWEVSQSHRDEFWITYQGRDY